MKVRGIIYLLIILLLGGVVINEYFSLGLNRVRLESEWISNHNSYSAKIEKIKNEINEVLGQYKDNVSIYYYNLKSKEGYSLNENKEFISASLKKLPQVMQVLDLIEKDKFTLDTKINYIKEEDFEEGSGVLQDEEGLEAITIRRLIELSIKESDNIAYNMLKRICNDTLVKYMDERFDIKDIEKGDYIYFTAKQNFKMLYELYMNFNENPNYEWVIQLMKETSFSDRLARDLPNGIVANKIGSYYRYYHDMGIVYGKEPYILVVLTKDIGEVVDIPGYTIDEESKVASDCGEKACDIIANISKKVYLSE